MFPSEQAVTMHALAAQLLSLPPHAFSASSFVLPGRGPLVVSAFSHIRARRFDLACLVLIPVIEMGLRRIFASVNNLPHHLFAQTKKYYTTLDGFGQRSKHQLLLDTLIACAGGGDDLQDDDVDDDDDGNLTLKQNNVLPASSSPSSPPPSPPSSSSPPHANALFTELGHGCISLLLDMFLYQDGPCIRGKLAHGMTDLATLHMPCASDNTNNIHNTNNSDEAGDDATCMPTVLAYLLVVFAALCDKYTDDKHRVPGPVRECAEIVALHQSMFHPHQRLRAHVASAHQSLLALSALVAVRPFTIDRSPEKPKEGIMQVRLPPSGMDGPEPTTQHATAEPLVLLDKANRFESDAAMSLKVRNATQTATTNLLRRIVALSLPPGLFGGGEEAAAASSSSSCSASLKERLLLARRHMLLASVFHVDVDHSQGDRQAQVAAKQSGSQENDQPAQGKGNGKHKGKGFPPHAQWLQAIAFPSSPALPLSSLSPLPIPFSSFSVLSRLIDHAPFRFSINLVPLFKSILTTAESICDLLAATLVASEEAVVLRKARTTQRRQYCSLLLLSSAFVQALALVLLAVETSIVELLCNNSSSSSPHAAKFLLRLCNELVSLGGCCGFVSQDGDTGDSVKRKSYPKALQDFNLFVSNNKVCNGFGRGC